MGDAADQNGSDAFATEYSPIISTRVVARSLQHATLYVRISSKNWGGLWRGNRTQQRSTAVSLNPSSSTLLSSGSLSAPFFALNHVVYWLPVWLRVLLRRPSDCSRCRFPSHRYHLDKLAIFPMSEEE